ncbi:MAG: GNAT family N-acetyltransferase, partial [Dehalococcoidia bacterium]
RRDIDLLASWPAYSEPYGSFGFTFVGLDPSGMDTLYQQRHAQPRRLSLVADHRSVKSIGYLALLDIDWERGQSGNMGIRVHPSWCNNGVGTAMLALIRDWWFASGMTGLRLDVASSNTRALRCYEKAGFVRCGEFWRPAPDLRGADLSDPRWSFLHGCVRLTGDVPELRFLWMEMVPG